MPTAELFVVATPIGNLEDMTHRAVRILGSVSLVAAEDTRRTRILLSHFGIERPMLALHEHNEAGLAPQLVARLLGGDSIALVSDAGTPLLSDPGYRLVREAIGAGITVRPVPGPSALAAALSIAGLPTDRFVFEGFLPAAQGARIAVLERLRGETRTLVLYESSHRACDSLADLATVFGTEREAVVCREMTKQFETVLRGPLGVLHDRLANDAVQRKGEFVFVVAGAAPPADEQVSRAVDIGRALLEFLPASQAARAAAKICGVPRREVYAQLEERPACG